MQIILAALLGFLLDLLLADPSWMPHPVIFMGKMISLLEKILRKLLPTTKGGELAGGILLAIFLPVFTLAVSIALLFGAALIHPALAFCLQVLFSWQVLAMCGLRRESKMVYDKLVGATLPEARKQVARIVGRDTQDLSEEGVAKACVETVAENFSDGVFAPLFYLLIGGAPLALCYKSINTMDSMVGYKNEKYLYFGRAAAKLDDAVNWIPARNSALLLVLAAFLLGEDGRGAFRIWKRDRRNHASPNSAQTEAAMAGALSVQLAGPAYYFGERYEKPTIGDAKSPVVPATILRANKLLYGGGCIGIVLLSLLRAGVVFALMFF